MGAWSMGPITKFMNEVNSSSVGFFFRLCFLDNSKCCHTRKYEYSIIRKHPTQSQYTNTGQTCPGTNLLMLSVYRGSYQSTDFKVFGLTSRGFKPTTFRLLGGRSTTRPQSH